MPRGTVPSGSGVGTGEGVPISRTVFPLPNRPRETLGHRIRSTGTREFDVLNKEFWALANYTKLRSDGSLVGGLLI